jgi:hypothetical protein
MAGRIAGLLAARWEGLGLVTVGAPPYKGFRFPAEIISHCVWLYHRFPLSLREGQEMMLQRGIIVSHETVRQWCAKFGQTYANGLRRRRARPGDTWHLDEVFITINDKRQYLWHCQLGELRAADGHVKPGLGSRVDLWSGAQAAAVVVPVISFQVVNRMSISRRYSSADSRWRRGRKCGEIPLNADRNRCACPAEVNFFITRSRTRVGW